MKTLDNFNRADFQALLNRYVFRHCPWTVPPGTPRTHKYACKACDKTVLELNYNASRLWSYDSKRKDEFSTLLEHQVEQHSLQSCEHCGEFITRRGMKRHQNSDDCTSARRKYEMSKRGYEIIELSEINTILVNKREELLEFTKWDDFQAVDEIQQTYLNVYNKIKADLGVVVARSEYNSTKNNRRKRWLSQNWAPWIVVQYLSLLNEYEPTFLPALVEFAEADDDKRHSMLGVLELSRSNG